MIQLIFQSNLELKILFKSKNWKFRHDLFVYRPRGHNPEDANPKSNLSTGHRPENNHKANKTTIIINDNNKDINHKEASHQRWDIKFKTAEATINITSTMGWFTTHQEVVNTPIAKHIIYT